MADRNRILWEKCAEAHGHECGGLTIGYKAALYAVELMGLAQDETGCVSAWEDLICVAENKACSIDAIRVILGCTEERGNLIFHLTEKQIYTIFNKKTREAFRLTLKDRPEGITRENSFAYYQGMEPAEMFVAEPVQIPFPESAARQSSFVCSGCGEETPASWIRFVEGKPFCLDCFAEREDEK